MIGIVVVSHSHALAAAAIDLASEMVSDDNRPALVNAGGLDDETFGTDAAKVAAAIAEADSGDGVLVLLDLGSAVLSAEMALEFCDPDLADRVQLTSAPLVEGLVAAVVTAGGGVDVDAAASEARDGLAAKQDQVGDVTGESRAAAGSAFTAEASAELRVTAPHGLHARPAARLVSLVQTFDADVRLTNLDSGRGPVSAASVSRVATLDARQGTKLKVEAAGAQADDALAAVEELAATGFGDLDTSDDAPTQPATTGSGLDVVVGPAVVVDAQVDTSGYVAGDDERARFDAAVAVVERELAETAERTRASVGTSQAEVFETYRLMLTDADLLHDVRAAIADGRDVVDAWTARMQDDREAFERLPDAYQRARAHDVTSLEQRVLAALVGVPRTDVSDASGVLVVDQLDPADATAVDASRVTGIVTRRGGATGHGVILARSRGIPVYTDAGRALDDVSDGVVVAFDRRTREVVVDPDDAQRCDFEERRGAQERQRREAQEHAHEPAVTTDGVQVEVCANVVSREGATEAVAQGADGSGLVRTELLFGDRATAPDVEEQVTAFTAIAEAFGRRRITVRTWDVGADKPLPYVSLEPEDNPFLGVRGVRTFADDPTLLRDQVEAICRVAQQHPVGLMFPMVTTRAEVDRCLRLVDDACATLGERPEQLQVGIMVELPAAALRADTLTAGLDFVSIGTNDLTQYTTASERGNAHVAHLADVLDPAVLRLVERTCAGVADGVLVAVCGDAASDPEVARVLVGLGVRELSATAPSVATVKAALRASSLAELRDLAQEALGQVSAADVRALV